MDLRTVKEDLLGGNYETPAEFAKDVKMIFTNSRNYNTNKRSRVGTLLLLLLLLLNNNNDNRIYIIANFSQFFINFLLATFFRYTQ